MVSLLSNDGKHGRYDLSWQKSPWIFLRSVFLTRCIEKQGNIYQRSVESQAGNIKLFALTIAESTDGTAAAQLAVFIGYW